MLRDSTSAGGRTNESTYSTREANLWQSCASSRLRQPLRVARQDVECPDRLLRGGARPAAGKKRGPLRNPLRLHEQVAEGRVGQIGGGGGDGHLRIAGDLDLARLVAGVGERQAA